jgi:hypothetical protein
VDAYVQAGVAQGAVLRCGGKAPDGPEYADGWYYLWDNDWRRPNENKSVAFIHEKLEGIGKAMGAKVIAAASSAEKLEVARNAGADELINYSETSLRERLKDLTGGQGVDVIYDPVG